MQFVCVYQASNCCIAWKSERKGEKCKFNCESQDFVPKLATWWELYMFRNMVPPQAAAVTTTHEEHVFPLSSYSVKSWESREEGRRAESTTRESVEESEDVSRDGVVFQLEKNESEAIMFRVELRRMWRNASTDERGTCSFQLASLIVTFKWNPFASINQIIMSNKT